MTKMLIVAALMVTVFVTIAIAQDVPVPDIATNDAAKNALDTGAESLISPANYVFSPQSGVALEDMSSDTTQLIGPGVDNANSTLADIGFLFRYDGGFFTNFGVTSNGMVRLGALVGGTSEQNLIASTANAPKIMPYWDDLCVGNTGKVHYKKIPGPVGTQKLVIEWQNMKITRGNSCDGSGAGTFQLWLYDRTGVIQFVYGSGMNTAATPNGGYSVGIQSGAASNFASVTTAGNSVSYQTANDVQIDAIAPGTSYLFSPPIPSGVSALTTAPTQTTVRLNWTDNASNETAYLVRRTTDHVSFYFVGNTLPANSTTFTDTDLIPGTSYFYYVNALTDGAFGPDVFTSATTLPGAAFSSTAVGGPWSSPSTWAGGVVPDAVDDVTITSGATVVIDTANARAGNVTVGSGGASPARLVFGETGAFKLTVTNGVFIHANDFLTTGGGNANQHTLSISGDLINDGTLDLSTNNNLAAAALVFTGNANSVFGGSGAVTDIFTLKMDKGVSKVLELTMSNFSVRGSTTDGPGSAYLFLNTGTFKISGTFTGSHRTFTGATYQILKNAGFWLNNPNYTVTGQTGNVLHQGLFRLSAGTFNVGTGFGHAFILDRDSVTTIEGGQMFVTGGLGNSTKLTYSQTGGTLTTCTWGTSSTPPGGCINLGGTGTEGTVSLSGGDLVIQNSGSFLCPFGTSGNATLHFGNSSTAGAATFGARGILPNIHVDTTGGNHTVNVSDVDSNRHGQVRNITVDTGAILNLGSSHLHLVGNTFTNNGTLTTSTTQSMFLYFDGGPNLDVTYDGTGTMIRPISQIESSVRTLTLGPAVGTLLVRNITLYSTDVINSGKIRLVQANSQSVDVKLFDLATFDAVPIIDFDTGVWLHLEYSGTRTTGPEMPASGNIGRLTLGAGTITLVGDVVVNNGLSWGAG